MTYAVVVPSIYKPYTEECLKTVKFDGSVLVVDNTVKNAGVAASWNVGARYVRQKKLDHLILMSASMRFGEPGGMDFIRQLDTHCFEAALEPDDGIGWHLIAFHRATLEQVGWFDPNYHPAYYEDNDFSYRLQLAFGWRTKRPLWPKVHIDAHVETVAHGLKLGGVQVDMGKMLQRYIDKWGGEPGSETFT
jgi:hypothetical protein